MIKSGKQLNLAMTLQQELELSGFMINSMLEALDPKQYQALVELRKAVHKKCAFAKALDSIDGLLMEGRGILYNQQTPYHLDSADPRRAWVALLVLGCFTSGPLYIPALNLLLFYEPGMSLILFSSPSYLFLTSGTLIFMRGHILPHEVEAWVGGQRVCIVHFTHQSLWDEFGMECP